MTEQEFKKARQLQHKICDADSFLEKINNNKLKLFMATLEGKHYVWDIANNVDVNVELFDYIKAAIMDYRNSLKKEFGAIECTLDKAVVETKFNKGDRVYHKNLKQYGTFIGYAWESNDECDVEFEAEDDYVESKHVSVNQLILADSLKNMNIL